MRDPDLQKHLEDVPSHQLARELNRRDDGHRCDRYEIGGYPGVSFCRKAGAALVGEVLTERDALRERLKIELARGREVDSKLDNLAERFKLLEIENNERRRQLAAVKADRENVWVWRGGEENHPESLACPVVMTADTLQAILAETEELKGQVGYLVQALEQDDVGLSRALKKIQRIVAGATWLLEARGPYEWDDDRYKDEAGQIIRPVLEICEAELSTSGTLMMTTLRDMKAKAAAWCAEQFDRDALQNQVTLAKAEAAGAGSLLLDVQHDCIRATKALNAVTTQRNELSQALIESERKIETWKPFALGLKRDLDTLMQYVDDAKAAAQLCGRVTGEPLADFIKRIAPGIAKVKEIAMRSGDDLCWRAINEVLEAFDFDAVADTCAALTREDFLGNCGRYFDALGAGTKYETQVERDQRVARDALRRAAVHLRAVPHHVPVRDVDAHAGAVSFGHVAADVLDALAAAPTAL